MAKAGKRVKLNKSFTFLLFTQLHFISNDQLCIEALRNKLQSGVDIKIVYLEVEIDDADPRGNEPVYHNNKIVGVVTSGAYGFRVKKSLAFAYVNSDLADKGTEFLIGIQGQKRKAKVVSSPLYDPENKKLKA